MSVLLIAPQETEAWLVGPDHPSADEGVPLCEIHADRISVPFGWNLTDDRPPKRRGRRKKAAARPATKREPTRRPPSKAADQAKAPPEPPPGPEPEAEPPTAEVADPVPPSQVPVDADRVAAELAEEEPRLSVVPGDDDPDKTFDFSDEGQGALWNEPHAVDTEPDDSTPLLKRAFRVVRDDPV